MIEAVNRKIYGAVTLPQMSTGATDMAFVRAKGVQCYGIGPMIDKEDAPKGFGAHSDQERHPGRCVIPVRAVQLGNRYDAGSGYELTKTPNCLTQSTSGYSETPVAGVTPCADTEHTRQR